MIKYFILFGTRNCHLCEQAQELLSYYKAYLNDQIVFEVIDIVEDQQWFDKYSLRIPVLYHPESQIDLGWPFDQHSLAKFINKIVENTQQESSRSG